MPVTVSVSRTEPPQLGAEYSLNVIEPVPSGVFAPDIVAVSLNVPPTTPVAGCCVVVSVGVAQLEMAMLAGPTRSFICALVELPEVRDSPNAVPKASHARPLLLKPTVAAVRSIEASPNSSVPGSSPFAGLIASVAVDPAKTAASATFEARVTSDVHADPVHWEYPIDALPLWKS